MEPDVTLGGWLARRAEVAPHRRALTFEGTTRTYRELQDRIDRLAAVLAAGGIGPGDRVAFLDLNHPTYLETLFACSRLGAIFVPLNFRLAGPEFEYILGDAGAHTLVAGPEHREVIDGIRDGIPVQRYIGRGGEPADSWEDYEAAVDGAEPLADPAGAAPDDVAVIMYTSGTTGHPKGAMLTHANFWWNNASHMLLVDYHVDDVTLVFAPLFHIGGLNVTTLMTLQKGGEIVLHRQFDPGAALRDIAVHRVNTAFGVPAMFLFMSQHPDFDTADMSSIRTLACGGAPVPEPLMKTYAARGVPMTEGYGMTEAAPGLTFLTAEFSESKVGSAGTPVFFTEVKLIDTDGNTIDEPYVKGEICGRGPNIMKGYWNRPEATAAAIDADGWFRSGDIGYVDEDGFYFIADRVKDMVISGGENVYPAEVEEVLFDHPDVTEAAVIGLPDEKWGEAVTAVVTLRPGTTVTLDALRAFAERRLARYKLPTRLEIVDEIPHNASGKVLKRQLREDFD